MAVYGNLLKSVNEDVHENVSFDQLFNFIYESDNEVNLMFERANLITILKEENTSLAIPNDINNASNPEQVKKKFSEKIKELFNKFVEWVKSAFKNLKQKATEFYLKYNFQDEFLSKWKDKVTWANLEKAKSKGWKGIPESVPSVIEPISINDTRLIKMFKSDFEKLNNQIDNLSKSDSQESLDDNEKKVKDIIKNIESSNNLLNGSESDNIIDMRNNEIMFGNETVPFLGYMKNSGAPQGRYYPNQKLFGNNKHFAETGQKEIKNIKVTGNASIELVKDVTLSNDKDMMKIGKDNYKEDKEILANKIYYLSCKYRYASTSLYIKVSSRSLNGLVGALWKQHRAAVQNYILYVHAIEKFCTA